MSIELMTLAWKTHFQSGRKMVLLALCDNASDEGMCFPSISVLVRKCSMAERTVQGHVADLEELGIVRREFRTGRSTIYHIIPDKIRTPQPLHPHPAENAPTPYVGCTPPPQPLHPPPIDFAPRIINEPSTEPSLNQTPGEKAKKRHGTDDDHKAAHWMFELVRKVNATAREPNYDIWANEIRLMREIDERTHAEICKLFLWAKQDSFWCANIQSPGKLREKWNTLAERMQRGQQPQRAAGAPAKSVAEQNAENREKARQMLFGKNPEATEGVISHA